MKKSRTLPIIIILALIGMSIYLLRSTDVKNLDRRDIVVDIPDTFEK